jgi:AhpD family alkylhydroperoxidase
MIQYTSTLPIMSNRASVPPPPGPRLDLAEVLPDVYQAQIRLGRAAAAAFSASGLPAALRELVLMRVSQLNGCAFCLDMHAKDARHAGESEDRLYLLSAWRESPHYEPTERVALALAEAITLVTADHVPDEVWDAAGSVLSPEQLAAIVAVTVAINGWNRIAISTRMTPGAYQPA